MVWSIVISKKCVYVIQLCLNTNPGRYIVSRRHPVSNYSHKYLIICPVGQSVMCSKLISYNLLSVRLKLTIKHDLALICCYIRQLFNDTLQEEMHSGRPRPALILDWVVVTSTQSFPPNLPLLRDFWFTLPL